MWDLIRLVAVAGLCRVAYEATQPRPVAISATCGRKLTGFADSASLCQEPEAGVVRLPPQVREWQRRELQRYREAQERKWHNWAEALYEDGPEP